MRTPSLVELLLDAEDLCTTPGTRHGDQASSTPTNAQDNRPTEDAALDGLVAVGWSHVEQRRLIAAERGTAMVRSVCAEIREGRSGRAELAAALDALDGPGEVDPDAGWRLSDTGGVSRAEAEAAYRVQLARYQRGARPTPPRRPPHVMTRQQRNELTEANERRAA